MKKMDPIVPPMGSVRKPPMGSVRNPPMGSVRSPHGPPCPHGRPRAPTGPLRTVPARGKPSTPTHPPVNVVGIIWVLVSSINAGFRIHLCQVLVAHCVRVVFSDQSISAASWSENNEKHTKHQDSRAFTDGNVQFFAIATYKPLPGFV